MNCYVKLQFHTDIISDHIKVFSSCVNLNLDVDVNVWWSEQYICDCWFVCQLASSTLDASAKIYAGRVDAIHSEMYKVLSGLGRGSNNQQKAGEYELHQIKLYPLYMMVDSVIMKLNPCVKLQNSDVCWLMFLFQLSHAWPFKRLLSQFPLCSGRFLVADPHLRFLVWRYSMKSLALASVNIHH